MTEKTEKKTQKLSDERSVVKKLIIREQDCIFRNENQLQTINFNQYRAEWPDFVRGIVKIFTGKDDEIGFKTKIAKSEAKIAQRQTDINSILSEAWIASKGYNDAVELLTKVSETFRDLRMELGKILREGRKNKHRDLCREQFLMVSIPKKIAKMSPTQSQSSTKRSMGVTSGVADAWVHKSPIFGTNPRSRVAVNPDF